MNTMNTTMHATHAHHRRTLATGALILALILDPLGVRAQSVLVRGAGETLEAAARLSGRAIQPVARKAALATLERAALQHGDDALLAARTGGLELIEAASTHGDDVWRLAAKATPGATRALALRPAELLPLARRVGPEVLELEARVPGISLQASTHFGDDAVRYFATRVPPQDATRLVGLAAHADSPATRQLLLQTYKQRGTALLDRLDWKTVLATGLSAAMITGAYKVSDGVQEGLTTVARAQPAVFAGVLRDSLLWLTLPLVMLLAGLAFLLLRKLGLFQRKPALAQQTAPPQPRPNHTTPRP